MDEPGWFSAEFVFFYVLFAVEYYIYINITWEMSDSFAPELHLHKRSWLVPSRFIDHHDAQWNMIRGALPLIGTAMGVFLVLSYLLRVVTKAEVGKDHTKEGQKKQEASAVEENTSDNSSVHSMHTQASGLSATKRAGGTTGNGGGGNGGGNGGGDVGADPVLNSRNASKAGSTRVRLLFYAVCGVGFVFVCHGYPAMFLLAIALGNFVLCMVVGATRVHLSSSWSVPVLPLLTWLYATFFLFANDIYHGYAFAWIDPRLAWLDEWRGLYGWHVAFNFVVLKMISFNMDYYWMVSGTESAILRKRPQLMEFVHGSPSYAYRVEAHQPHSLYSLTAYAAYVLYAPLYLAGPIITFNAFVSQVRSPQSSHSNGAIAWYAVRLVFSMTLMELGLTYFYVNAFNKYDVWRTHDLEPYKIGAIAYWTLMFLWLKFFIIWRMFRLFALVDGVETVENMNRCLNNNYNFRGFWRAWHRSFNRWLIRYVYVPLGGTAQLKYNAFVVFTFVALWHDIQMRLLYWGWLISLFLLPEVFVTWYFNHPARAWIRAKWWYRHACSAAAAFQIFVMMVVNLIGFTVGLDGMHLMLEKIMQPSGLLFLFLMFLSFFGATHMMFKIRHQEAEAAAEKKSG